MSALQCNKCSIFKEPDGFMKDVRLKRGYASDCRDCRNKYYREWNKKNPGKAKKAHDEYFRRHPEAYGRWYKENRARHNKRSAENYQKRIKENPEKEAARERTAYLMRRHGITVEEYDRMLMSQRGVCAICFDHCRTGKRLAVDHCHETGRIRGLLCLDCNQTLGKFMDVPERFEQAARYLREITR